MKLPITIVDSQGNRTTHATADSAERAMDPIDVRSGDYTAMDADGKHLVIDVVVEGAPRTKWLRLFPSPQERTRLQDPDGDSTALQQADR